MNFDGYFAAPANFLVFAGGSFTSSALSVSQSKSVSMSKGQASEIQEFATKVLHSKQNCNKIEKTLAQKQHIADKRMNVSTTMTDHT